MGESQVYHDWEWFTRATWSLGQSDTLHMQFSITSITQIDKQHY
jgi:hypothetical protein